MAKGDQQPPADSGSSGSGGGTGVPLTEEQQLTARKIADLTQQASDAAAAAAEAKRSEAAAKGELDRANVELAALRAENERLRASLTALEAANVHRDSLPSLPVDLPKGAFQLVESVTIAAYGEGKKFVRKDARRGAVVVVGSLDDAQELQERIGQSAAVYAIDRATADELRALKHIR